MSSSDSVVQPGLYLLETFCCIPLSSFLIRCNSPLSNQQCWCYFTQLSHISFQKVLFIFMFVFQCCLIFLNHLFQNKNFLCSILWWSYVLALQSTDLKCNKYAQRKKPNHFHQDLKTLSKSSFGFWCWGRGCSDKVHQRIIPKSQFQNLKI